MKAPTSTRPGVGFSAPILAILICAHAAATNWIVDVNNGPGTNFTTISAAVAAAQPGDQILVRQGTYGENVLVNKGVTIVGWNAATYPLTVPPSSFQTAVWGTLGIVNIPVGETCVVSGLIFARPSSLGGTTIGVLDSSGTIVLDRVIVPNGNVTISNCTDVILEQVHVRQLPGDIPPVAGVTISNSWVQANDLDATGGNVTAEPNFFAAGGSALEVFDNATVALARPKLIGGTGGGPWITSPSPAGGIAIRASTGGIVSIADDAGSSSYLVGGQGGLRGAGSSLSIPSGNGGNAVQADLAGSITNKKPMPLFGGAPGGNLAGGPVGASGATSATFTNGVYQAITDLPCVYRHISGSVPGGFFLFSHHAAAPGLPVAFGVMVEISLAIVPPALQFQSGNPLTAIVLGTGTANGLGYLDFGFSLPAGLTPQVGLSVVVQTADVLNSTFFLGNPSTFVLGF